VVFPATHGAVGEDGSLQGLLEVQGLPYVGSGVLASALAMDKRTARRLFVSVGLPVAKGIALARPAEGGQGAPLAAERARREVGAALVVKPSSAGSAIGVARLDESASLQDVARAIESVWALDPFALVEHFARGREVTCGVLDARAHGPAIALPPIEIVSPADPFYTYEARYAPGRSVHTCPAPLGEGVNAEVQQLALSAHLALGCRDLSRVDLIVGDLGDPGALTLLEVNTLPGMTATSLYPEAAAVAGLAFPALCDLLVRSAVERGVPVRPPALPMPP
jgi:D-alanine-D-alanine ligase